ncbi:hypothetical protein B0H13DRAFT_2314317 [Mycena leptocephala]|nr:hypothetical protein B0H13DRAFT_2314317 [Mycena leptocephala]
MSERGNPTLTQRAEIEQSSSSRIGCPPTFISHPCTSSLPPLYATPPHGSYATPLCSVPGLLPRHRVVVVKPVPSRAPARIAPCHYHVSYGRLFYRSSVTPLDLVVEVILMRIA